MLIDTILFDVKNLNTTNGSSSEQTIKMINTIEKAARDLDFLGHRYELYNSTTISIIEQAMSDAMRHEWVRCISAIRCDSQAKFDALLKFLGNWKQRLEYLEANIRGNISTHIGEAFNTTQKVENKIATPQKIQPKTGTQKKGKCWVCNLDGDNRIFFN